jgi:predicted ferric reductase
MGVIMGKCLQTYNVIAAILIFIGIPSLLYALGEFPRGTILKETISLLTILAFSMMLGQFFLARSNRSVLKVHKSSSVLKIHKFIGYFFIVILLAHPFLIVLPRYFESGVAPEDAFMTLITSYDRPGVLLGMVAYGMMLILGITSLFRKKLPLSYRTWRLFHGILSIVFIAFASWHAINLGRHINNAFTFYFLILAIFGVLLLLNTYFSKSTKKVGGE